MAIASPLRKRGPLDPSIAYRHSQGRQCDCGWRLSD